MNDIRTNTTRAAVLGAVKDLVDGEYQHARGQTLTALLEARKEMGLKSAAVTLPDGTPVADITLVDKSEQVVVTNRKDFVQWVADRAPDKVTEEESPRLKVAKTLTAEFKHIRLEVSPEDVVNMASAVMAVLGIDSSTPDPRVDPKYEAQILDEVKPFPAADDSEEDPGQHVFLPSTGEVVPGVKHYPAADPTSFQMRYRKGGRDAIGTAWRNHKLDGIEGLPEVES